MKLFLAVIVHFVGGAACTTHHSGASGDAGMDTKGAASYPPGIDPAWAQEVHERVEAAALESTAHAWPCRFTATTLAGSHVDQPGIPYTFGVEPVDVGGPESDVRRDFQVTFDTTSQIPNPDDPEHPIGGSRSMIVSYISYVDPSLALTAGAYVYEFHGALTDRLTIAATGNAPKTMSFDKLNEAGGIVLTIACASGID